jgi:hypothetical protein
MGSDPRICVAFLLASGVAACDSAWALDLTLQVSSRRQAEFSAYPAQLVLVTDTSSEAGIAGPEGQALHVANLCRAKDSDFVVRLNLNGDDCAQLPRFVQAWLEPREEGADSKCGAFDEPIELRGLRRLPDSALSAETAVFEDFSGKCDDLHAAVTLKLGW